MKILAIFSKSQLDSNNKHLRSTSFIKNNTEKFYYSFNSLMLRSNYWCSKLINNCNNIQTFIPTRRLSPMRKFISILLLHRRKCIYSNYRILYNNANEILLFAIYLMFHSMCIIFSINTEIEIMYSLVNFAVFPLLFWKFLLIFFYFHNRKYNSITDSAVFIS